MGRLSSAYARGGLDHPTNCARFCHRPAGDARRTGFSAGDFVVSFVSIFGRPTAALRITEKTMNNESSFENPDPLKEVLCQAFPETPVSEGLLARIAAAADQSGRQRVGLRERTPQPWRRAVVTAVSATICGIVLGLTLGISTFGRTAYGGGKAEEPPAVYLALLCGYTDLEGGNP